MTGWGTTYEEAPELATPGTSDTFWMLMMNISNVTELFPRSNP